MTNKTRQIIVVVAVFVIALASLGTIIGLLVNTGQLSEYSDGFRYELNGSKATIVGYTGSDEDVTIPDKVKGNRVVAIARDAFKDGSSVKSIKFNCSYSSFSIADYAFKDMKSLEKVVLPANLKEISSGAFEGCTSLKEVIIPDGLTRIGDNAFKNCSALNFVYGKENYSTEGEGAIKKGVMYMPSQLLEIGSYAFYECTAIVELHISKNLEKIGDYAFYGCQKFSDLEVESDSEITGIGSWAFYNTILRSTKSAKLSFPNLVSIGESAFKSVKGEFSYLELPATVKSIGSEAFLGSSTREIAFNEDIELESMGEGVFQNCTYLEEVTLPKAIKEIPAKTFMGCYRLLYTNDFKIGKDVEKIGEGAFAIYTGRGTSYSVTTYSRKVIEVDKENENFIITRLEDNTREGNTTSTYQQGLLTDAEGKTVYAYYGSYDNASTNTMGKYFRFLDVEGNYITSIETIKAYAFAGVEFEYIQLPTTIKELGDYVFYDSKMSVCYTSATGLKSITNTTFSKVEDGKPEIDVLILQGISNVTEILNMLKEYDVNATTYSGNLQ